MPRTCTGIDVGSRTAVAVRGHVKDNSFVVQGFAVAPNPGGTVAEGWTALAMPFKATSARVGVSGRDVNVRYTRVPRVPDWQLRKLMRFEVEEVGDQSGAEVASDFNVLPEMPEIEGEDVVLLAMAREELLEQHLDGLMARGGQLDAFTPNAIGLYNAWLHYGVVMEDTVLVANIGHETIDLLLVRGTDLLFARNMTGGSSMFDEAIAGRFNVSPGKAEELKHQLVDLAPGAHYESPNHEKASRACMGPAGQLLSLLESSVLFCKSQMKISGLRVDRVALCGGGAALEGLDRYLAGGMSVPVERFDPWRVIDDSKLDPESQALLEEYGLEAVCALGLATAGSDPDAYSIEILPAAVRRKREFWLGTAWLFAAAALAVLYLGWFGVTRSQQLSELEAENLTKQSELRRKSGADLQAQGQLERNAEKEALARELFALAGSGEQVARTLAGIRATLPRDFWVDEMASDWGFDDELGVSNEETRPIIHVEGSTVEGTDAVSDVFQVFVGGLRERLPGGSTVKDRMLNRNEGFVLDLTTLAPRDDAAAEEDAE